MDIVAKVEEAGVVVCFACFRVFSLSTNRRSSHVYRVCKSFSEMKQNE